MPVQSRQLPTNSRTVLDGLVDPNTRHDRSSADGAQPSLSGREPAGSPDSPPSLAGSDTETETGGGSNLPWYRREKWLAVQIAAIIPILGAMLVPETYRLPLCVIGGALVAVGTVMLLRHKPTPASSGSGGA